MEESISGNIDFITAFPQLRRSSVGVRNKKLLKVFFTFFRFGLFFNFLRFFYPEKLLCRHFWSKSQTFEYGERALIKKLPLNKVVLDDLLVQSDRFLDDQVAKNILIDTVKKVQIK